MRKYPPPGMLAASSLKHSCTKCQAAIPAVIPLLMGTSVDVRAGAATVLGTLARQGQTAMPALLPLLSTCQKELNSSHIDTCRN